MDNQSKERSNRSPVEKGHDLRNAPQEQHSKSASRRSSLRIKIIAWSFVPTVIILAAVAWFTFYSYQQVTQELVLKQDQELTQSKANQATQALVDRVNPILLSLMFNVDVNKDALLVERAALLLDQKDQLVPFDGGIVFLDAQGRVVATQPERPEIIGQDWSDRAYFQESRRTPGQAAFTDIVSDGSGGQPVVALALAMLSERGEFAGTVVFMFQVSAAKAGTLYNTLAELELGDTVYILDGEKRVVYHPDLRQVGVDYSGEERLQPIFSGQQSSGVFRSGVGQVVVSSAPVPGNASWLLVKEQSWRELMRPSLGYRNLLLGFLALGVIIPVIVVTIGVRRITQPIQDMIRAAQGVARGNFDQRISAPTGDELDELAEQFNLMSTELQDSYANLEQRVAARTRELSTLLEVSRQVVSTLELEPLLGLILDQLKSVVGYDGASILGLDGEHLTVLAYRGPIPGQEALNVRFSLDSAAVNREVIRRRGPVVIPDVRADTPLARAFQETAGEQLETVFGYIRCWMGVPLIVKERMVGMLSLDHREPSFYTAQQAELALAFAAQVAVAIENARLYQAEQERRRQMEALYRADEEVYGHLELDEVLHALVNVATDILQADKSSLMVWDEGRERLLAQAARGFNHETVAQMVFAPDEGVVGHVIANGQPVIVEDTRADPRVARRITEAEGIRSFMHVPIKIDGHIFGVFNVDYLQPRVFGQEEQRLFIALAQRAALAIENAQLYEQAQKLAVVEERQRLARDLHDAVTQTLFSAGLIAEVVPRLWERNHDEARRRLAELRELTRGALAEMRTLLLELRPSALAEARLGDLLRQLAEAVTGRARVPVSVEVEGECDLAYELKVVLYRVAQEALNNVAKHAKASQAQVKLGCAPGEVRLSVSDDGCGFDVDCVPPDHLGLGIMRERAQAVGARLVVKSRVGQGTRVEVVWTEKTQDK